LRQAAAVVRSGRVGNAAAAVGARIRQAQVNFDLTIDALVAGGTHTQVAEARVVVADAAVDAGTAGAGA
jgi:hypothetical protein